VRDQTLEGEERRLLVHIQSSGFFLDLWMSEVMCTPLEDVFKYGDKVFFIKACEDRVDQERALSRVKACLKPDPIRYSYHGFFGSCQTFCTRIFGMQAIDRLNPEAFMTSTTMMKCAISMLFGDKRQALMEAMDARFAAPDMPRVSLEGSDDLVKICRPSFLDYIIRRQTGLRS